jgi:hypothetical protein
MRAFAFLLLSLAACDCSGDTGIGDPCEADDAPEGCGAACGPEMPCTAPLICTADGRCEPPPRPDSGRRPGDGSVCADVMLEARPVTPNVILMIDQSGSMTESFGGSNRWDVLRDTLMDTPDGLVFDLQGQVRFGLAMYSARADGGDPGPPVGECPIVTSVPVAIDNYDAIDAVYGPADPIDETPTGDAMNVIVDGIGSVPDPTMDPTILILATDGEPDRCEELNPQMGQAEALAAARRAYSMGIRVFIISVGEGAVSAAHLQDMANAGTGDAAGVDAPYWVAGDDAGLRDALREIVGGVLSCVVNLEGRLMGDACLGRVLLNGREIPCGDENGWEAVDSDTIELLGDACDELQSDSGATLTASFPCDVAAPF